MNTLHATLPAMTAGGSAIVTGSFAAMIKGGIGGEPAGLAYSYAVSIGAAGRLAGNLGRLKEWDGRFPSRGD